jgi:hypothetical protein
MLFALVPLGRSRLRASTLLRGEPDPATSTNFDEPPAVVGWDLGYPDVTNPTYNVEQYHWQYRGEDGGRDDFCPMCFSYPAGLPPAY